MATSNFFVVRSLLPKYMILDENARPLPDLVFKRRQRPFLPLGLPAVLRADHQQHRHRGGRRRGPQVLLDRRQQVVAADRCREAVRLGPRVGCEAQPDPRRGV